VVVVICEADFKAASEYFHCIAYTMASPTAGTNPPAEREPYVAYPFVAFTNKVFKLNAVDALIVGDDNFVVPCKVAALTKGEVTLVVALIVVVTNVVTVCVPRVALELTRFDSETPL
jgi:hypothetical protein